MLVCLAADVDVNCSVCGLLSCFPVGSGGGRSGTRSELAFGFDDGGGGGGFGQVTGFDGGNRVTYTLSNPEILHERKVLGVFKVYIEFLQFYCATLCIAR